LQRTVCETGRHGGKVLSGAGTVHFKAKMHMQIKAMRC